MDTEFPRGRGPSRKIMEIPGVGGEPWSPLEWKILGGGGPTGKKTLHGGVWTFSGTAQLHLFQSKPREM